MVSFALYKLNASFVERETGDIFIDIELVNLFTSHCGACEKIVIPLISTYIFLLVLKGKLESIERVFVILLPAFIRVEVEHHFKFLL
jgi:hypothetical protein